MIFLLCVLQKKMQLKGGVLLLNYDLPTYRVKNFYLLKITVDDMLQLHFRPCFSFSKSYFCSFLSSIKSNGPLIAGGTEPLGLT